jgi:hypothetical protein
MLYRLPLSEDNMEHSVAKQINDMMIEFSGRLNQSIKLVMDNCDDDEFKRYRRTVGKIMGEMFVEIMTPIYKEYPELTPEELKPEKSQTKRADSID